MSPTSKKYVLITGCSAGGIGFELAREFQRRGLHVFATARTPSKMDQLAGLPNVTLLRLDVTDQSSVDAAVAEVRALTGGKLDYLVNNSGAQHVAPALETDLATAQALFDVNFFGVLRMTQACAPLLIATAASSGSGGSGVVNLCSISGHLHTPWMGAYQASKAAAEMLSETLRLELRPLGVRVVTLVTGAVDTNIMTGASHVELSAGSPYKDKPVEEAIARLTSGDDGIKRTPAPEFARRVVDDVLGGASGRIWRGSMAGMVSFMTKWLPRSILDNLIAGDSTGLPALSKKVQGQ